MTIRLPRRGRSKGRGKEPKLGKHLGRARWRGITIAVVVLALCVGAGVGPAAADGQERATDTANAFALDVEAYEEAHDVSQNEAAARVADRAAVTDAIREANARPTEFAGLYFTHDNGYVLHVIRIESNPNFTLDVPALQSLTIAYESGTKSMADTKALVDEISAKFTVSMARADERTGMVIVQVPSQSDADAIKERYGDSVDVTVAQQAVGESWSCPSYTQCTPLTGGTKIFPNDDPTHHQCSVGFNAKGQNDGGLKMITVGHCGSQDWDHYNQLIGTTAKNCLDSGGCGPLGLHYDLSKTPNNTTWGTPNDCLITDIPGGHGCYVPSLGAYNSSSITTGDDVHVSGFITNYHPSINIDDNQVNYTLTGYSWTLSGFYTGDHTDPGDSGGPAFYNSYVWGLVSGASQGNWNTYAYAWDAEQLNVDVCETSSC
jgi:hypothetical protein